MGNAPSASYSLTMRVQIANKPGMLGKVTSAIGEAGGDIGAIDLVEAGSQFITRDISCNASDEGHGQRITAAVKALSDVTVKNVSDRTFLMHLGGKIEVNGKVSVKTRDDLSMAYTPGVARVCMAIHHDPQKAYALTIKQNCVAVVTDGTAVLGLGDIGPFGAAPVMEGKALIFKEFAGVDAFPICLATKDVDEIVSIVKAISPIFGGINLEDISAPRCFDIETRLQRDLEAPHEGRGEAHRRLRPGGRDLSRPHREHELDEGVVRPAHESQTPPRHRGRCAGGRRRLHRTERPRCGGVEGHQGHAPGPDRLRDGQPDP